MSDYWKKRMDELEKETKKSPSQSYWDRKMQELEDEKKTTVNFSSKKKDEDEDDIAPIKSTKSERKNEIFGLDFFQKGAFEDGYDFGDVTKSILGTAGDVGLNAVKGVWNIGEGVGDLISYGVAAVADKMGEDAFARGVREKAKESLFDNATKPAQDFLNKYSVLGETSDAILQGVGQVAGIYATGGLGASAGLGSAGTTALTSGTMFLSGTGSGMGEAYQMGADDLQALKIGLNSGAADAVSELIFGGLGKGINALGFGKGLSSADDMLATLAGSKFKNQIAKNVVEYGIKSGAEGLEEVIAGIAQAYGKYDTLLKDQGMTFGDVLKDENLLEQFVVGAFTSGLAQGSGLHMANKTGTDFITGLNQDEQAVVDREVKNRIAEAEKDGKKLTAKQKANIQSEVEKDLEKGYISTDTIEETLASDLFEKYKRDSEWETSIQNEYDELYSMKNADKSNKQIDREAELKKHLESIKGKDSKALRSQITAKVSERVKGSRLAESYNEKARAFEGYVADYTKYTGAKHPKSVRETVESAIKAGVSNTNRVHDFVDMVAKTSADTGLTFSFQSNKQVKAEFIERTQKRIDALKAIEQPTAEEASQLTKLTELLEKVESGKITVNGSNSNGSIVLNLDSPKVLNRTVGHELTHSLEKVKSYDALKESLFAYAKTKGIDIDSEINTRKLMYDGVAKADPEAELVSDLVGDFLFNDIEYVNHLSVENRNVFQRIFDEIKHLLKLATAGSKEARQLEQVKRNMEKAYREAGKSEGDTKYSLGDINYPRNMINYNDTSGRRTAEDESVNSLVKRKKVTSVKVDDISAELAGTNWVDKGDARRAIREILKQFLGEDMVFNLGDRSAIAYLTSNGIDHTLAGENTRDKAVALSKFYELVGNAEYSYSSLSDEHSKTVGKEDWDYFVSVAEIEGGGTVPLVFAIRTIDKDVRSQIYSIATKKNLTIPRGDGTQVNPANAHPSYGDSSSSKDIVIPSELDVKYSLSDSDGRQLTQEQQEFFKDSVVRDENGNLKVMYHGTPNGDFTVFKDGTYFTESKDYADRYQNPGASSISTGKVASNPKTFEVYLNIKKPFDIADADAREIYINKYIKGGNAMGINPYLSDAEYAKIESIDWTEGEDLRDFLIENEYDYDGLVLDEGGTGGYGDEVQSRGKSYVVFSPEQVKNVDNQNPTSDPDIRYSLSEDSQGRPLTKEQQEFFKDSKIRVSEVDGWKNTISENGALLPVYHGTNSGDFYEFDKNTIGSANDSGWYGRGFYFAFTKGEASYYGRRVLECYLNVKKPFMFSEELQEFDGQDTGTPGGGFASFIINLSEKFPEIASKTYVEVSPKESDEIQRRTFVDFAKEIKEVFNDDRLRIVEVEDRGKTIYEYKYSRDVDSVDASERIKNIIKEKYIDGFWEAEYWNKKGVISDADFYEICDLLEKYGESQFQDVWLRMRYNSREHAEKLRLSAVVEYLEDHKYSYINQRSNHYYMENYVGDAFTQEIRKRGYDGIIQSRFGDEIVVFDSSQIKLTDNKNPTSNPDIRKSLSNGAEGFTPVGRNEVYGRDLLQQAAPVQEEVAPVDDKMKATAFEVSAVPEATVAKNATTAPTVSEEESVAPATEDSSVAEMFPDDLAPIESELDKLNQEKEQLEGRMMDMANSGDFSEFESVNTRYSEVQNRIAELENEISESESGRVNSLDDANMPPEMDAPYPGEPNEVADPFADRDISDVGSRSVKAYQYENPEVKPFFTEAALGMLGDLHNGTKGERIFNDDVYYQSGGEKGWMGTKRHTTSDIAELLDTYHYTYDEIEKGLNAIIEDDGKENNAVSKRIEFMLNDRLMNGYTDVWGEPIPANQEYINLLNEKQITEYSREAFDNLFANADEYAPTMEESYAPILNSDPRKGKNVPTYTNASGQQTYIPNGATYDAVPADGAPIRTEAALGGNGQQTFVTTEDKLNNRRPQVGSDDIAPLFDTTARKGVPEGQQAFMPDAGVPKTVTRKELHAGIIDNIKTFFANKGLDFDKILDSAKRIHTIAINDNTPQRVNDKTFGYEAGEALNEVTFNRQALHVSEGVKWQNQEIAKLRELSKKYGIKPRSKESAAAQMYAEGFYVGKNNEIISYGDRELAIDFPDPVKQAQIKALSRDATIRQIYDDALKAINESRTRNGYPEIPRLDNYFLHFRAQADTFSRLGIPFNPESIKIKDLPTDINGMTADRKPGQPYFASSMHRKGMRTDFDLLGGVEKYINSAMPQIYLIDDIQTERALWGYIANKYGQANGLEDLDELGLEAQAERIHQVYNGHLSNYARFLNEHANHLAGKTAMMDRTAEGVIGRRGLEAVNTINQQTSRNQVGYNISSAGTNFIPMMETIARTPKQDCVKAFAQTVSNVFRKDGFVENDPALIRRKGVDKFSKTLWERLSDPGYVLMGAVDNVTSEFVVRAKYNQYVRNGMNSEQAHIKAGEWASRVMGDRSTGQMPLLYNSKTFGILTKYQLEVRNTLDSQFYDTIQETKASEKDVEEGLAKNAKIAAKATWKIAQIAALNHAFGMAYEKIAGYNPAFDIISVIATLFGLDDDEEDEDTFGDNFEQAFQELLGDLPYTSLVKDGGRIPMADALPINDFVTNKDKYGQPIGEGPWGWLTGRAKTVAKALPYALPGGYGQVKKTVAGMKMFSDDHPIAGSYTDSGSLRFPVDDTLVNRAQAAVFGQYASSNARDYFDNDLAPLKENQIQEFVDVGISIQDYRKYREGLKGKDTLGEKVAYINSLDLPIATKNMLVNNISDRKEAIDLSDFGEYDDWGEFEYAHKYPDKYAFLQDNNISADQYKDFDDDTKDAWNWAYQNPGKYAMSRAVTSDIVEYRRYASDLNDIKADKDSSGKSISGSRKEKVLDYINSLDIGYEERLILFKNEYNSDDTYNYEIIDYLNSRSDLSFEERIAILRELGFDVTDDGNISWY